MKIRGQKKSQLAPNLQSSAHLALMAVDVQGAARRQAGGKENDTPGKVRRGSGKGEARTMKPDPTKDIRRDSKSTTSKTKGAGKPPKSPKDAKGAGKPPKAPKDAGKKGITKTPEPPKPNKHIRVSPNELVAGLAGSAVFAVVSKVSKLVKAKFKRSDAATSANEKKEQNEKEHVKTLMTPEDLAKLSSMKAELRDAMSQLREQRKTMDHLAKQNREMARENVLLKKAAANAAREAREAAAAAKGFNNNANAPSPSRLLFPVNASPEGSPRGSPSERVSTSNDAATLLDAALSKLLPPLDASVDDTSRLVRLVTRNSLANVLRDELVIVDLSVRDQPGYIEEEDAWAGVPRGSPQSANSEYFDDARSMRSAASGVSGISRFSGISDLSTLSAAEAALTRMRTKFVLMARIKNHR